MTEEVKVEETKEVIVEDVVVIDPKAHDTMKNDMFKYKRQAEDAKAEKATLEAQIAKGKTDALVENEQYKTLYEQSEARATAAETKADGLAESFVNVERDRALEAHLVKEGINPKFLPLVSSLDKSKLIVETTDQGRVNILGLEGFSAELKTTYGEDMFPPEAAPTINTTTETKKVVVTEGQKLAPTEVLKLQREDPAGYKTYMKGQTGAS